MLLYDVFYSDNKSFDSNIPLPINKIGYNFIKKGSKAICKNNREFLIFDGKKWIEYVMCYECGGVFGNHNGEYYPIDDSEIKSLLNQEINNLPKVYCEECN